MTDTFHVFPVPYSFPSYHLTLQSLRSQQHKKINKQINHSDYATGWMIQSMNPGWGKKFFFPPNHSGRIYCSPSPHPALCSVGTGVLSYWRSGQGMKLTTPFHLSPRFRMCGLIPLVTLYIVWQTGKTVTSMHTANINTTKKLVIHYKRLMIIWAWRIVSFHTHQWTRVTGQAKQG